MNIKFFIFYFCLGFIHLCWATELDPVVDVYSEISNLYDPTIEDLQKIQFKLSNTTRPIIERMGRTAFIAKEFKLIGMNSDEMPERGHILVNSDEADRQNCIILYSSFNQNYPAGVRRLIEVIKKSSFKGHIHYRIGGWPNVSQGDLVLAHVPFAFKACFFKEVQQMGYKRVLWMDASILPYASLNKVFRLIKKTGIFVQKFRYNLGHPMHAMNEDAAAAFGVTVEQIKSIPTCQASVIGVDFTNEKAANLIDAWHAAAKNPFAFFSVLSDQNALNILIYKMGFSNKMFPQKTLGTPENVNKETLFIIDRKFVKPKGPW